MIQYVKLPARKMIEANTIRFGLKFYNRMLYDIRFITLTYLLYSLVIMKFYCGKKLIFRSPVMPRFSRGDCISFNEYLITTN